MSGWLVAGIVALLLAVIAAAVFNRLVALRNRCRNAFSQVDVQLKRRHDLIPNLVEATRGYLQHERATLEAVIRARSAAVTAGAAFSARPADPAALHGVLAAESVLGGAVGRFVGLAEAYPDLKANQTVAQLMENLTSTENRIAFARQAYNDAVAVYNTACEQFPQFLLARPAGFALAELFELQSPVEAAAPSAKL